MEKQIDSSSELTEPIPVNADPISKDLIFDYLDDISVHRRYFKFLLGVSAATVYGSVISICNEVSPKAIMTFLFGLGVSIYSFRGLVQEGNSKEYFDSLLDKMNTIKS